VRAESPERMKVVEAEAVPVAEGSMCAVAKRDGDAPPGSQAASRTKSRLRDPGDPIGTVGVAAAGGEARGQTGVPHCRDRVSDRPIVPMTPPKETRRAEGRGRPEGNLRGEAKARTQGRGALPPNLTRVNEAARRDKRTRFTALLHHVDVAALERAFWRVKRSAAPGVDGETVESYEGNLQERLRELCDRVHRGSYRPKPVRRVYIPKAGGGQRPIGVPTLEDKVVQGAVAEVLSAIYEVDFPGSPTGFGRDDILTGHCRRCTRG